MKKNKIIGGVIFTLLLFSMIIAPETEAKVDIFCVEPCGGSSNSEITITPIEIEEEPIRIITSGSSKSKKDLDKNNRYTFFGRGLRQFKCGGETYYFDHHLIWDRVLDSNLKSVSSAKLNIFTDHTFTLNNCSINYEVDRYMVTLQKRE